MRSGAITTTFAAALLLASGAAFGQTAPNGAGAPAASDTTNKDDLVTCRYEKTTGSNFTHRVCHTQREWRQMNVDAKDMLERMDSGTQGNGPGG
jgi:hypothetical protein